MSGPKSADYYLTPEQRRQLAEQRRVNELKNQLRKLSVSGAFSQTALDEYSARADEIMKTEGNDNGCADMIKEVGCIAEKLKAEYDKADTLTDSVSLKNCYDNIKQLNAKKDTLLLRAKQADAQNAAMLKKVYVSQLENAMDTDFSGIKSKAQEELDEIRRKIDDMLSEAENTPYLSDELIAEINTAREKAVNFCDASILKNFRAVTVSGIVKRCGEYAALYSEFEELYNEYQVLCEMEGITAQKFTCCREDTDKLRTLTEDMKLAADKADEQEYIRCSIDEVMEEMGYKLIGDRSVTKKSGRRFRSELYTFSEGTAVNITHSSNGQITMELAGIDSADRQPTDAESNMLCSEMESFCGKFSEFEKRLAKKGVVSRHISILPPAPEYAQIINVSDYDIKSGADYSEIRADRKAGAERAKRME